MNIKLKLEALEETFIEWREAKLQYNDNKEDLLYRLNNIVSYTDGVNICIDDEDTYLAISITADKDAASKALEKLYKPEIKSEIDRNKDLYIRYISLSNEYYAQEREILEYLDDNREKYGISEDAEIRITQASVYFYTDEFTPDMELEEEFYKLVEALNEH